ncbi:MAG: DUF4097 family beta strand repeat-containing protein [Pseudonocardiaceae bacterium]
MTEDFVRAQDFTTDGPIELDLALGAGQIDVHLSDSDSDAADTVHVELRHDPNAGSPWTQGMSSMLNWVNDQFGDQLGTDLRGSASDAVAETAIDMVGNRLVVRAPKALPLRHIPLALTVNAPTGSHLSIKTSSAGVTVHGTADRADVATASGEIELGPTQGSVTARSGSGRITLGPVPGTLQVRTSSGDVRATTVSGSATVATGTSSVWVGGADGDVLARTGSGDVTVADAGAGAVELLTGSGEIRVGVRAGVPAEVDLSSGSGTVSSELDVSETPPDGEVPLHIRARTGSGRAVITRAM